MSFQIPDISAQRAMLTPNHVGLEELERGRVSSYRELDICARKTAALLVQHGVRCGDRVAVLCRNRGEFFELLFGCAKLGAILVPLNWRMPAAELGVLLQDCKPKVLLFGSEDAAVAETFASRHLQTVGLDDCTSAGFSVGCEAAAPCAEREFWPADETWYLLYTSGTTGKPKAVIQTYGMALANHINITQGMGLRGSDTALNFLPLFHTAGINLVTLPMLISGGRVLMLSGFDVDRTFEVLAAGKVDVFFAVPAVYQALSQHPAFDSLQLESVRSWGCGGAPLPEKLVTTYAERGALICNGMGMTETGPTVFLMDQAGVKQKIGSVGKPQVLAAARIVNEDGQDVPVGESGELLFSGPGITPGYWNRPEETAKAFINTCWLRSGDLARMDEDGYFYIVGRSKEMYISGAENIYPAEVEDVLVQHPAILDAAVIGVPNERWGEVGRAYLEPYPEAAFPSDEELVKFCRKRLAPFKVPKSFVRVTEFPRTAAGKIQKHLIEDPQRKS